MGEEKEKMKTGKKLVIALIMILLILTAGAYGYGVHYFTDHFFFLFQFLKIPSLFFSIFPFIGFDMVCPILQTIFCRDHR